MGSLAIFRAKRAPMPSGVAGDTKATRKHYGSKKKMFARCRSTGTLLSRVFWFFFLQKRTAYFPVPPTAPEARISRLQFARSGPRARGVHLLAG
jgi:hypothetical protein